MNRTLNATLCQTFERKPLAVVDLSSVGAELTPLQLRTLAKALLQVADDADAAPMTPRRYVRQEKRYSLAEVLKT